MIASEAELAWIAGLFEGEGWFCVTGNGRRGGAMTFRMNLQMTDQEIVQKLASIAGGSASPIKRATDPNHWKQQYRWVVYGQRAEELFGRIAPYLGTRRRSRGEELIAKVRRDHLGRRPWRAPLPTSESRSLW